MAFHLNMRRVGVGAAAMALMASASVFAASSASAASGQEACANQPGVGSLCVFETSTGYNASFNSATDDLVDFKLWITHGPVSDKGAFNAKATWIYTYFFGTGDQSVAHLCLDSQDGQFSPLCTPNLNN